MKANNFIYLFVNVDQMIHIYWLQVIITSFFFLKNGVLLQFVVHVKVTKHESKIANILEQSYWSAIN